ncbi:c6 zinc finger domain-containing [Trichoderma cornu-damae]|uniref:C6 zinc finger domain-containing n=1 Tax=Trichoderma cornu-damae TaxID=654480 RepID=A0A9P8QPF4_9HYPO|nr:c6 zinc finger domain-containing [Trichoderma cornu-damae]
MEKLDKTSEVSPVKTRRRKVKTGFRGKKMQGLQNAVVMSQRHRIVGRPASIGYEYFRRYTVTKLPGLFRCEFWGSLVLQASEQEPAVLHALTALGAAHKNEEHLSLTEYNKAIQHLRQSLNRGDKGALRVCLITCMLFVCIELLRGGFKAGHSHLSNGLRILREVQSREGITASDGGIVLRLHAESVEDTLVEAFSRLSLQAALFDQASSYPLFVRERNAHSSRAYDIPPRFSSPGDARKHLDALINGSHLLGQKASRLLLDGQAFPEMLYQDQGHLQAALMKWLVALGSSHEEIPTWNTRFGMPMLLLYHTMTRIMAATALRGANEMIFDDYLPDFALLLKQSSDLWDMVRSDLHRFFRVKGTYVPDINFSIDMGLMPPLYYALTKCRQPNLRRMTLELLKQVPHREGAWDGSMVIYMGGILTELEEGDIYEGIDIVPTCNLPEPSQADALPVIPASQRFNIVNVALPDFAGGTATLHCRRYEGNGLWESKAVQFDAEFRKLNPFALERADGVPAG